MSSNELNQFQQSVERARSILVILPSRPTTDQLAAALALYLVLPEMGKNVNVACTSKPSNASNLIGSDKIVSSIGNSSNFIVSLDYEEGSIEKVSYNIEGDKFNLVIEPRPGFNFSKDKVHFNNGVGQADLLIMIGVSNPEDTGEMFAQLEQKKKKTDVINIDTNNRNMRYGRTNLVYDNMGSVSELVTQILSEMQLLTNTDAASNLLTGIGEATNQFTSPSTSSDSFESAALLMRVGAKKLSVAPAAHAPTEYRPPVQQPAPWGQQPQNRQPYSQPSQSYGAPAPRPPVAPRSGPRPHTQPMQPMMGHQNPLPQGMPPVSNPPHKADDTTPPDWLKPKIFRSRDTKGPQTPPNYRPSEGSKGS